MNVLIKVSLWTKVKDTEVEDKITEDSRCIEEEVMELSRKKETVLAGVHSTAADKVRFLCLNIPAVQFSTCPELCVLDEFLSQLTSFFLTITA